MVGPVRVSALEGLTFITEYILDQDEEYAHRIKKMLDENHPHYRRNDAGSTSEEEDGPVDFSEDMEEPDAFLDVYEEGHAEDLVLPFALTDRV